jgi:hypothetical protein
MRTYLNPWLDGPAGAPTGYLLAVVVVAIATRVRFAIDPSQGTHGPYGDLYSATLIFAVFVELGPGLVATALRGVAGLGLLAEPLDRLLSGSPDELLRFSAYLVVRVASRPRLGPADGDAHPPILEAPV